MIGLPTPADRSRATAREGAFTLIEVVIAAFIIALVIGTAAAALRTTSNSATQTKLTSRGNSVVTGVLRKLEANTSWMSQCTGTAVCTVPIATAITPGDLALLTEESEATIRHNLTVQARPVDLAADGMGIGTGPNNDRDGQVNDVYRITVTDRVDGPLLPQPRTFQATGSVNVAERGRTGSVRVRMCGITPFIDERMSPGLCASGTTATMPVVAPPACTNAQTTKSICTPWGFVPASLRTLQIRPLSGVRITLTGPLVGQSTSKTAATTGTGVADFQGLDPGTYRVSVGSPSVGGVPYTTWSSKSVPSSGTLVVERGALREATLMMRPAMPRVTLRVETIDKTDPFAPRVVPHAFYNQTVRLLPLPAARSTYERGVADNGWTRITGTPASGTTTVTLNDSHPGIYSSSLVNYPQSYVSPLRTPTTYLYVPATGAMPSPVLRQDYCEPVRRRTIVASRCGANFRWCFVGSTFVGDCNDNPSIAGGSTAGNGAA